MDVIEHLPKSEACHLLTETQKHTKQMIVFTPRGFMHQNDGIWNTHRSGWVESDFGECWSVYVIPRFHTVDFKCNRLNRPVDAIVAAYNSEK